MLFLQICKRKKKRSFKSEKKRLTDLSCNIYVSFSASSASCFFAVCCSSASVGGVGGGECSYTIGCRMASSSSESVSLFRPTVAHSPRPRAVTPEAPASNWTWRHECQLSVTPSRRVGCRVIPCSEGVQARRQVLVEQNGQVGFFRLDLSPVDPAGDRGIPAQVCRVNIQDPCEENDKIHKGTFPHSLSLGFYSSPSVVHTAGYQWLAWDFHQKQFL